MKERPIIFSAPMVRAILAGNKTQTRRIVKVRRGDHGMVIRPRDDAWWPYRSGDGQGPDCADGFEHPYDSPYGQAEDRLWVKETWRPGIVQSYGLDGGRDAGVAIHYAAGGAPRHVGSRELPEGWRLPQAATQGKNVSPLFMPRWASRITLHVVGIRVERLQDCSEADAIAEGVERRPVLTARASYKSLWDSINGAGSWDRNPWVWVVEFRKIEQ